MCGQRMKIEGERRGEREKNSTEYSPLRQDKCRYPADKGGGVEQLEDDHITR